MNLGDLRILTAGKIGTIDAACPECGPKCKTATNRTRKVLRIWDDGAFVTFKCSRCEISGWARDDAQQFAPSRESKPAEPVQDKAELARYLWSRASPGGLHEIYLRSRECFIASPNLRTLPARGEHPPAMIARFGEGAITGVHLTKLRLDGGGKAGTDRDKIMIGPSMGQPIIVNNNQDRGELLVAEGIEDSASLALVTGWSAWAAGSAGRIAACLTGAAHFNKVFIAVDYDEAGNSALARAQAVRADIIPLRIARLLGPRDALDANKALIRHGKEILLGAIEWAEAQNEFAQGRISFHAMQNRVDGIAAFRLAAVQL